MKNIVRWLRKSAWMSENTVYLSVLSLVIGTLILLVNVIILGGWIPTLSSRISNFDDEISDKERKIQIREYDLMMYRIADGQALDLRNTLAILEGLKFTETDQYRAAMTRAHQAQLGAVVSLASVAEIPNIEQQKSRWEQLSFRELNELIPVLSPKAEEAINKLVRSKRELEDTRKKYNYSILQWSRWAAFFQVVALLFLAIGDTVSKFFGK